MKPTFTAWLVVFALANVPTFAQSNYVEGYVVTADNDTLRGLINNQDWEINPEYIRFKTNSSEQATVYYPHQLRGFYLSTREHYLGKRVSVDKSPVNLAQMNVFTTPVVVVDTVFLRVYAKGAVSLYYYKDENLKNHFYVDKNGSEPEELIRRRSLTEQGQLATVEKYKGQLAFLLSDCPKSAKAAERTPFQLSKLQKLVLDYNACGSGVADPSGNYAKQIEKVKWVLGVVGGFTSTKVKFSGFPPSINDLRFEPARSLVVGPSLEIVLPRRRRQYSFYNELIYKPYQTIAPNPRLSLPSRFSLDVAYVKIMTTFRWRYASGRVRPFANVGIANSFAIRAKTNVIQETRGYEQSLVGGGGRNVPSVGSRTAL